MIGKCILLLPVFYSLLPYLPPIWIRGGLILHLELVMEQTYTSECHSDAVLVTGLYDIIIAHGASSLGNILYA